MRFDELPSDDGIVAEIGRRVAAHRAALALTQGDLAERAGVGRSTVQRIEGGGSIQLTSLVKILRVLDRLDGLDAVLASEIPSPLADLKRERGRRQRVRHKAARAADADAPAVADAAPWTWGDDATDLT